MYCGVVHQERQRTRRHVVDDDVDTTELRRATAASSAIALRSLRSHATLTARRSSLDDVGDLVEVRTRFSRR